MDLDVFQVNPQSEAAGVFPSRKLVEAVKFMFASTGAPACACNFSLEEAVEEGKRAEREQEREWRGVLVRACVPA